MQNTRATDDSIQSFRWVGSEEAFLDIADVTSCGPVVIGRYGGRRRAGAIKNEDGALVWCAGSGLWELAVLLDAHFSAESAALVIDAVGGERETILGILAQPIERAFPLLHAFFLGLFGSPEFRARCHEVEGEASCLIAARKGSYLWWLSVGDCLGYIFHPQLARMGEYRLNERRFYEWIGENNTFDQPVPGYTTGIHRLFEDTTILALTTDGLFESVTEFYDYPERLYATVAADDDDGEPQLMRGVWAALGRVHEVRGRDSATILAWTYRQTP
jgi:hypothetical protein